MFFQAMRKGILVLALSVCAAASQAAPYAALVMDARTGKVVHSRNADTRLHPASLTKMMTLYVVFQEIQRGRLSLDQKVKVSSYAASKPPSKLGLKAGQWISLRNLIRASAVKSANDAAAVLAEAVSGSEAAFAKKMTATARAMGMRKTTFKNASGLTQTGHLSTARDMAILGRQLFYDFPQYYNLFSRMSTDAGVKTVRNTNRRLLSNYKGADGIKTGYTRAAGYNLVASAERGRERVIVSMFGGSSSAARNKQVAALMDLGFQRMPRNVRVVRPKRVRPAGSDAPVRKPVAVAALPKETTSGRKVVIRRAGKVLALQKSTRPRPRPVAPAADQIMIARAVNQAVEEIVASAAPLVPAQQAPDAAEAQSKLARSVRPVPRPAERVVAAAVAPDSAETVVDQAVGDSWSVQIGSFSGRHQAESVLLKAALQDPEALEGGKRHVHPATVNGRPVYKARFVGLSRQAAETACARMQARASDCETISPSS